LKEAEKATEEQMEAARWTGSRTIGSRTLREHAFPDDRTNRQNNPIIRAGILDSEALAR
jgi:hypothetical protein